ncbi:MAG: NAD-glutamate dehydrogenase [Rhodospirillales bacterium]|nr:NAD-glutamate dehydrogenase [Rhodospirillales bacterium]
MSNKQIDQAIKALPPKAPEAMKAFLQAFFEKAPADDLAMMDPVIMAGTAENHWDMAQKRKPGEASIRIYTAFADKDEANAGHTVIDIVADNMAFLVDSIAAEITSAHNRLIHLLIRPTLHVTLDKNGKIKSFSNDKKTTASEQMQAHLHIELQGMVPEKLISKLEQDLLHIIDDVKYGTRDWAAMREKLRSCQKALNNAPSKYSDREIEEYLYFLEYLYKDNFTLLGYREYKYVERNGKLLSQTVKGASLGLLHDDVLPVYISANKDGLPQDLQRMRRDMPPLTISKVNKKSTVHRPVPLDAVSVKQFDKNGKVTGEVLFIGLFTSVTYSRSIQDVPYLRRKAELVTKRAGFAGGTHDDKALRHILEKYPRDELFQISVDDLMVTALSILRLQERQRIALYTRADPFGRYISCLVYVPRDRYDTRLRMKIQKILADELQGTVDNFHTNLDDSPLARVMYTVYIDQNKKKKYDFHKIEAKLQEAGRLWSEKLAATLHDIGTGENDTLKIVERYGEAFPVSYREAFQPRQAIYDIQKIEGVLKNGRFSLDLYKCKMCEGNQLRVKIYHKDEPVTLSAILPVMENMGLQVMSELPFKIQIAGEQSPVWVHDFMLESREENNAAKIETVKDIFETALTKIWYGETEDDSLNRLVLLAEMDWRSIMILRACVRYLRQARYPFSTRYMERALTNNPTLAQQIVNLFKALHDPENGDDAQVKAAGFSIAIDHALEAVASLDEDRILRSITNIVDASLRTNFYQKNAEGEYKHYLSIKLDSKAIHDLPEPKPYREIYVYAPWMEGVHLRGDVIARGGLRWSDRHEDFRTEILGLMKAQQVKNSVIVPMGAKGGFIVKKPPKEGGRAAFIEEGIRCYKTLIRGLLDITDNRKGKKVIPPKDVVRRDGDDPYLVVAADKGTATFSDIANGISAEYEFWLGDAFASGGSAGYDHKKMGITARGAWESVKRHFRELNHDIQTQPFDVIGVGDMSGDVFGNGMLLSEHIRLVGAFNHLHIVCDPDPDPAVSFAERKRLFEEVKGWDGYDTAKLSKGGRIYSRSDKSLELTQEIKDRFGLKNDRVTPSELIQAMLRARTDLLWFGGIGTYIKASSEEHSDVGDKINDSLRINAAEIRARVLGEGANLAITQRGRIEFALHGGKLNADFIDNSGGVDSSDHEVNIKILLAEVMASKTNSMTLPKRNKLLESMTNEVASLVLRHNYQQTQGISLAEMSAAENLTAHAEWIKDLEQDIGINRALEGLPDEDTIEKRLRSGKGLTRPELCVLISYAKITFTKDLLASNIPDLPETKDWLVSYFPTPLRKKYIKEIESHRLHREIVATTIASTMVDRLGPTFIKDRMEKTGASPADIACAFLIVRDAFGLVDMWNSIESLDNKVPAEVQLRAMRDIAKMTEREVTWFLTRLGRDPEITKDTREFKSGIAMLKEELENVITPQQIEAMQRHTSMGINDGLPKELAYQIALIPRLGAACDIIRTSLDCKMGIPVTAAAYFAVGEYFPLHWLRKQARYLSTDDRWTAEAIDGMIDHLYSSQTGLTIRVLNDMRNEIKSGACGPDGHDIVKCWLETHGHQAVQLEPLFTDMRRSGHVDLPMLIIAEQRLRHLYGG